MACASRALGCFTKAGCLSFCLKQLSGTLDIALVSVEMSGGGEPGPTQLALERLYTGVFLHVLLQGPRLGKALSALTANMGLLACHATRHKNTCIRLAPVRWQTLTSIGLCTHLPVKCNKVPAQGGNTLHISHQLHNGMQKRMQKEMTGEIRFSLPDHEMCNDHHI